jgi:RNA polymerase sigma-70 factor (ECF subfamily)
MLFENPYTLRVDETTGIPRYFVSFMDGWGVHRETEISRPVYKEFEDFVRIERNLTRWDERHTERFEQTEKMLSARMKNLPKSLEDTVFDGERNEHLRRAMQQLTEIQRRRFVLYHEFGLTYEQIAKMEGCSFVAVKYSVDKAKKAIRKNFEFFSD